MRAGRVVVERVRRAANADGAGESGLSALLGAHALHSAGDALVTVALAGTVFFSVPLGEARGRVALYLLLTLLPFSLLVPVAGPVLDRFRHGRRNVLAITTASRGLVAWSMAGLTGSLGLYPCALAILVLSRAYGVARSAATPRVRPEGVSLVAANARMNVAAVASASLAAAVGAGLAALVGTAWVLRLASVVLLAAAVCAVRLPAQIDEARAPRVKGLPRYRLLQGPPEVLRPLVAAVALRALAGLLTIFLAFLLKDQQSPAVVVAAVLGSAVVGQLVGTGIASRLPERITSRLTLASLAVPALACLAAAVLGGPALAALAAGLSGMSYSLSKFALDAALQTHVPGESTSGAFARSETGLQLAWALGGGIAVALPAVAAVGFGVAAAVPVLGIVAGARAAAGRPVLPPLRRRTPTAHADPSPAGHDAPPQPRDDASGHRTGRPDAARHETYRPDTGRHDTGPYVPGQYDDAPTRAARLTEPRPNGAAPQGDDAPTEPLRTGSYRVDDAPTEVLRPQAAPAAERRPEPRPAPPADPWVEAGNERPWWLEP